MTKTRRPKLNMPPGEHVGPAHGGPCDGKILRATARHIRVPVYQGHLMDPVYTHVGTPVYGSCEYVWLGDNEGWCVYEVQD